MLGASALDYGFAGDYDYSLITAIVDDETFAADADTYDDDVGFPRVFPETAAVTTRTAANLDDENGRYKNVCFHFKNSCRCICSASCLPAVICRYAAPLCWQSSQWRPAVLTPTAMSHEYRASSFGRMNTAATAYDSVARGAVTTGGIWGDNTARFNDDIFGRTPVFVPASKRLQPPPSPAPRLSLSVWN